MSRRNKDIEKAVKHTAKKHPKIFIAVVISFIILCVCLLGYMYVKKLWIFEESPTIDTGTKDEQKNDTPNNDENKNTQDKPNTDKPNTDKPNTGEPNNPPTDDSDNPPKTPSEDPLAELDKAKLSIHFLELGNKYTGDCTLIKYGNTEILIDAGSRKDSATTIKNYVSRYCTDGILEYVIATHAHQDHIAGFVGNVAGNTRTGILYQFKVGTLIQFAGTNATTAIYKDYVSATEYLKTQGTKVYTAKECWYETSGASKKYYLDDDKKISLNILYNYYYDNKTTDENDYSVCTLLTQEESDKTYNYLFTGDLEEEGESYLVDNNALPRVDLFKGGHHGSYTASTEKLLSIIKPQNVAVCCCTGTTEYTKNNANTFPSQAFIDRVSKYTQNIYCTTLITDYDKGEYTSLNGNIVFYYTDALKLYCTNNTLILKDTQWFKSNRTWKNN